MRSRLSTFSANSLSTPLGSLLVAEPSCGSSGFTRTASRKSHLPRPGEGCGEAALAFGGVVEPQALDTGRESPRRSKLRVSRVLGLGELRRWPFRVERRDEILDLHVDGVADLDPVATAVVDVLDRRHLHAEVLADERDDVGYGTAHLPREDGTELLSLLFARPLVHEHPDPPVALQHLLWSVEDQHHAEVAHVRAVDLTGVDVPGEHRGAAVVVGGCGEPGGDTGTHYVAIAVLDVRSFQSPSHSLSSFPHAPHRSVVCTYCS